jgi:membrane fusion protein, multidrug efflux system
VNESTPAAIVTTDEPPARQRALWIVGGAVLLAGLVWGGYWLLFQRHFESTDDAYVAADIVQVNSLVASTVTAVHVEDTQTVQRGELLVELDPADARLGVASAEADLAQAVRSVSAQFAHAAQLRADLAARRLGLQRSQRDLERRLPLADDGAISTEELVHARATVDEQSAAVAAARSELNTLEAQVLGTTVSAHPQVLRAAAAVRAAALAMRRTHLYAPVSGTVAKRSVQLGQRIVPAAALMVLVPLSDVWIDANLREVQIGRVRIGQPVSVEADVYGSDVKYHGHVAGLAAGSGNAFALLPAQNASGNWIKIVQRIPVRISLDPAEVSAHPLRVGTSASVSIDVSDRSGPAVSAPLRGAATTALETIEDPAVALRIKEIVAQNDPTHAVAAVRTPP